MTWTNDINTPVGKVRTLLSDTDQTEPIFTDEQLTFFLSQKNNNLQRATALAYRVIAGNQALTLKVIKLLQLSTDGQRTAQALLDTAAVFDASADFDEGASGDLFDWAEQVYPLNVDERIIKQILRVSP